MGNCGKVLKILYDKGLNEEEGSSSGVSSWLIKEYGNEVDFLIRKGFVGKYAIGKMNFIWLSKKGQDLVEKFSEKLSDII